MLCVTISKNLGFEERVSKLCSKANKKLSALSRMSRLLSLERRKIIFKGFFESQFKYCSLI